MTLTLEEIAHLVNGKVQGDPRLTIRGASPLQDAGCGHITLLDSHKNIDRLVQSQATAVVLSEPVSHLPIAQVIVKDPHAAFTSLIAFFRPKRNPRAAEISPRAIVDESAKLGQQVSVGAGAIIGRDCVIGDRTVIHAGVHIMDGCHIGSDCELFPAVVLYTDTNVGDRVLIHAGSILGAYGFGYKQVNGRHQRTAQLGWVEIENDVEIGAGVTIDRGTYGATRVGEGTKIDNQVMIAHNCRIGRHNLICSQVGIAGSSTTGDYVVMAGQVGLRDHIHVGDRTVIGAQAGVATDVPPDQTLLGSPAINQKDQLLIFALLPRLPQMRKDLRQVQSSVEQLTQQCAKLEEQQRGTCNPDSNGTLPTGSSKHAA